MHIDSTIETGECILHDSTKAPYIYDLFTKKIIMIDTLICSTSKILISIINTFKYHLKLRCTFYHDNQTWSLRQIYETKMSQT